MSGPQRRTASRLPPREDFADAPGEALTREEAHGQVCDICERSLTGEET